MPWLAPKIWMKMVTIKVRDQIRLLTGGPSLIFVPSCCLQRQLVQQDFASLRAAETMAHVF